MLLQFQDLPELWRISKLDFVRTRSTDAEISVKREVMVFEFFNYLDFCRFVSKGEMSIFK